MSIISKFFLLFSFLLLFFNGSALSFLLFNERLGTLFGYGLFIFSSLVAALFASIAEEPETTNNRFYCKTLLYGNLTIALYPFYLDFIANKIIPNLLSLIL